MEDGDSVPLTRSGGGERVLGELTLWVQTIRGTPQKFFLKNDQSLIKMDIFLLSSCTSNLT